MRKISSGGGGGSLKLRTIEIEKKKIKNVYAILCISMYMDGIDRLANEYA